MKFYVLAGVATASLIAMSTGAMADKRHIMDYAGSVSVPKITVSNIGSGVIAENTGNVTNHGKIKVGHDGIKGDAASVSISATGAVAQIASDTVNGNTTFNDRGTSTTNCGCYNLVLATNTGDIRNSGSISVEGGVSGAGTSLSISATGAAAVVSNTVINGASKGGRN